MAYQYRYVGESSRASFPDADGRAFFPSHGDEFESETQLDRPDVELVTPVVATYSYKTVSADTLEEDEDA